MSSSGRLAGTLESLMPRHESSTSSKVPLHEQPFCFHGSQISLSVFPKSPYCFNASSYNLFASSSTFFADGTTNESWSKIVSVSFDFCSFECVSLHLEKFSRTKTIKSRCVRGTRVAMCGIWDERASGWKKWARPCVPNIH